MGTNGIRKQLSRMCAECLHWSKRLIRVRQAISVSGLRWSRACRHHFRGDSGPGSVTCFFGDTYNLQERWKKSNVITKRTKNGAGEL